MRSTCLMFACIALTAVTLLRHSAAEDAVVKKDAPSESKSTLSADGESLADAIIRINADVKQKYGILSPTPLTVPKVKAAIEAATEELADSDANDRFAHVNALTAIGVSHEIPSSIRFYVAPIIGTYSKAQKEDFGDGRHVDISINYIIEVPSGTGRRAIGLTHIVELFRITKPKEQKVPLAPPLASNGQR